jgi:peptidoglycan/xylan/chitin deacetylase (PgdA/CDA1 family)
VTPHWAALMYHATPARHEDADYFAVPAPALARQLTWLRERAIAGRSLEAVLDAGAESHGVAITFDDAHRSNYDVAFPLFAEAGMSATIFVVPAWVGRTGYCTWSQLRELQAGGWSIQSHTQTHPFLSTLDAAAVTRELVDSRREIEDNIGAPVVTLALPNGDWPRRRFRHLLHDSGYRHIATSRWHANGDAERRRGVFGRYTVRRGTMPEAFESMVRQLPGTLSRESLRLSTLSLVRSALGVRRYGALRRYLVERRAAAPAAGMTPPP